MLRCLPSFFNFFTKSKKNKKKNKKGGWRVTCKLRKRRRAFLWRGKPSRNFELWNFEIFWTLRFTTKGPNNVELGYPRHWHKQKKTEGLTGKRKPEFLVIDFFGRVGQGFTLRFTTTKYVEFKWRILLFI